MPGEACRLHLVLHGTSGRAGLWCPRYTEGNSQMGTWAGRHSPRWAWLCCAALLGSLQSQAKREKTFKSGRITILSVPLSTLIIFPFAPCKLSNFFGLGFHTSQLPTQSLAALPFGRDLQSYSCIPETKIVPSMSPGPLGKRACCCFS